MIKTARAAHLRLSSAHSCPRPRPMPPDHEHRYRSQGPDRLLSPRILESKICLCRSVGAI